MVPPVRREQGTLAQSTRFASHGAESEQVSTRTRTWCTLSWSFGRLSLEHISCKDLLVHFESLGVITFLPDESNFRKEGLGFAQSLRKTVMAAGMRGAWHTACTVKQQDGKADATQPALSFPLCYSARHPSLQGGATHILLDLSGTFHRHIRQNAFQGVLCSVKLTEAMSCHTSSVLFIV